MFKKAFKRIKLSFRSSKSDRSAAQSYSSYRKSRNTFKNIK